MKVALLDSFWSGTANLLKSSGFEVTSTDFGSDIVVLRSGLHLSAEKIRELSEAGLKLIVRAGSGLDNIDLEECKRQRINVVSFPGANKQSVAEVTLGMMLLLSHRLGEANSLLKKNVSVNKNDLWGETLAEMTVGIIGYGKTGQAVADLLTKVGVKKIKVFKRNTLMNEKGIVEFTTFDDVLQSDLVSIHVPLTQETYHLFDRRSIELMKPGSYLINFSRRDVVDHEELIKHLACGKLGGYGTDVINPELDSTLIQMDNVFTTPHLGAQSESVHKKIAIEINNYLNEWRKSFLHV
ncbi:NAD(P)-dependent oxidoreductase [Paenibacillus chitinolyticus]|uniref:NAD(P)-dependent oxidoreductase n=1 Tax=Paenibacillus chitinolyticus TaxID=79263 RepID=UPI0036DB6B94